MILRQEDEGGREVVMTDEEECGQKLNGDQLVEISRLSCSENFACKRSVCTQDISKGY